MELKDRNERMGTNIQETKKIKETNKMRNSIIDTRYFAIENENELE